MVFVARPTNWMIEAQGLFKVCWFRTVAQKCPALPEMPRATSAFLNRFQAINLALPKRVIASRTGVLRLEEFVSFVYMTRMLGLPGIHVRQPQPSNHRQRQDTDSHYCVTASRSTSYPLELQITTDFVFKAISIYCTLEYVFLISGWLIPWVLIGY